MAGRKPKPTAVKKLEGNPGKRKLNTKEPMPGIQLRHEDDLFFFAGITRHADRVLRTDRIAMTAFNTTLVFCMHYAVFWIQTSIWAAFYTHGTAYVFFFMNHD